VSSCEAVFGQKYHPPLKCTMSELRECRSIHQRLRLSPDSWLETYVREHEIVDIEVPSDLQQSGGYKGLEEMDESDDEEEEGVESDKNAFPDLDEECGDKKDVINEEEVEPNVLYTPDKRTTSQVAPEDVSGKNGVDAQGKLTTGDDNDEDNDANDSNKVEYVGPPPQEGVACQLTYDSPTAVVQTVRENRMTTYPETFCSSVFSTLTVQQAWDCGFVACPQMSLGNQCEYNFL
jgi:hypothetical protein